MNRHAIVCFDLALADVGLADDVLRQVLHYYFAWATTTTMSRYHESADDVLMESQACWDKHSVTASALKEQMVRLV